MLEWNRCDVDSTVAVSLLEEYFADRAAGFPGGPAAYRAHFPARFDFASNNGVFVIATEATSGDDSDGSMCNDEVGTAALGCGGIRRLNSDTGGGVRFEVKHLYLRPHARGRGFGRALLAELEARAIQLGATELVLDTNASLTAAASLYRSAGFVATPPYNENPNATHWYAKKLSGHVSATTG